MKDDIFSYFSASGTSSFYLHLLQSKAHDSFFCYTTNTISYALNSL